MKKFSPFLVCFLCGICIIINGCSVFTEIKIINNTDERIIIFSSFTKKLITMDKNESEYIDHYSGPIIITLNSGKTWRYINLSPHGLLYEYSVKKHRLLGGIIRTITFLVDKDGKIYVIPPGEKYIDTRKLKQPPGFPLIPK